METTVKDLAGLNISVLPVAFTHDIMSSQPFIEYLKKIRQITDGIRDIPQATSENLIQELMKNLPTGADHIQLYRRAGDQALVPEEASASTKKQRFAIPKFAQQVRFFFSYPQARPRQQVGIKLYRNGRLLADSRRRQDFEAIYSKQFLRDGSVAYQSFRITSSDVSGEWLLELSDLSPAATEHLPRTDLLVDLRADLDLDIAVTPVPDALRAREPVEFRFTLFGQAEGKPYAIPIHKVDAFVLGRRPEEISRFSDKIRSIEYETTATASWNKFEQPGQYLLKGWVHFQPQDLPDLELKTYFEKRYTVKSAVPVESWFALEGSKKRASEEALQLPTLGEEVAYDVQNLQVRTDFRGTISGLTLDFEPFIHQELNTQLSRTWIRIRPEKIRGLSALRPARVRMHLQCPEIIPEGLPDGIYQGLLVLKNGLEELDAVQTKVKISIPRLIRNKANLDVQYEEASDYPPLTVEMTIYAPGAEAHEIEFPIWSTTNQGTDVLPYFPFSQGLQVVRKGSEFQGQARNNHVLYALSRESFPVSGKNSDAPGTISASVVVQDDSLDGQSFANTLRLNAEGHRPRAVKLITHIRFVPKNYLLAGALLLLALSFFLFLKWLGWRRNRTLFEGYTYEGEDESVALRHAGRNLGSFTQRQSGEKTGPSAVYFQGNPENQNTVLQPSQDADEIINWQGLNAAHQEHEGETISIQSAKGEYLFTVDSLPTRFEPNEFSFSIESSPLGKGNRMRVYFVLGALFLLAAVYVWFDPYGPVRILPL